MLRSLYREGQAAEPSAQGLHKEDFHRRTHPLPLQHNKTLPGCDKSSPGIISWSSCLQVWFIHWLFPPEHRLNDSQHTTFLQLWKQQNLSNYSQESSSRTQSGACQGWNAEEGSAAMWRGNYPETVGCLYQIYRYNEFWFLWTSLCFPTHGFRAASAPTGPTPDCSPAWQALWIIVFKVQGDVWVNVTLITLWAAHRYQLSFWQQQVPTEQTLPAVGFAAPHHTEIMENSFSSPLKWIQYY